jgi:apolipoprotein N-acyltransferase
VTLVGNAWALLGHSQRALILLQSASVTGVYGLSFLLALSATLVAEAWRQRAWRDAAIVWSRPVMAAQIGGAIVALAAVLGFGAWRLRHPPPATATFTAALVQGNIANAERARAEHAPEIIDRYLTLTASVQPLPPLVIWPENAIPVFPEDNAPLITPIRTFLRRAASALLAGAPRAGSRSGSAAIYNAAYLFTAERSAAVYDKQRLLPFVERFVLRPRDTPYLAGSANLPIDRGGARLGVLICYEVIDASLAAGAIARGANLLVNLSNDSWFDAGAGPAQHYELARFRAVESGLALLRATNSGISGAFDASGRELIRLPPGVPAAAAVEVALVDRPSFYARHGDWFAASCVALTLVGMASTKGQRVVVAALVAAPHQRL